MTKAQHNIVILSGAKRRSRAAESKHNIVILSGAQRRSRAAESKDDHQVLAFTANLNWKAGR
jgi:hypothetical protein